MTKPEKKTAPKKPRATASTTPARSAARPRTSNAKAPAVTTKPRVAAGRSTRPTPATGFELSHDVIAARAYDLFERSGHPHGRDVEFWLEAERQVKHPRKA